MSTESARRQLKAVLLIAHGSRRDEANRDLIQLAELVRVRTEFPVVEIAYLELAQPTIAQGADECVRRGAQQVLLLPYFLSAGAHVVEDLERARRELAGKFPQVEFILCKPLALHPLLVEVVIDRLREAEAARSG